MVRWRPEGILELNDLIVPEQALAPGASFEARAIILNHGTVAFRDPDGCDRSQTPCPTGLFEKEGFCIRVETSISGGDSGSSFQCIRLPQLLPPRREEVAITLTAPRSSGSHTVTATGVGTGSGNRSQPVSAQITVAEQVTQPERDRDTDRNGDQQEDKFDLVQFAIDNPGLAIGGTLVATVATREIIESILGE